MPRRSRACNWFRIDELCRIVVRGSKLVTEPGLRTCNSACSSTAAGEQLFPGW